VDECKPLAVGDELVEALRRAVEAGAYTRPPLSST